jgi:dethiobiotin synthetase
VSRPSRLIGVVGTGTEIGKTWVTSRLITLERNRGRRVAARKPVQSFSDGTDATDADRLAGASGEAVETVCPPHRWYAVPMAPPMAADVLGRGRIELAALIAEIRWAEAIDVGFVETVGGARSPLAHDCDSAGLIAALGVDEVLLVADAGLGTINGVRMTLDALQPCRVTVLLNRYDDNIELHRLNRHWLTERVEALILSNTNEWR